ncbi:hypothetical protein PSPO01_15280 [Paraphaeosphaeria sporulosa]
MQLNACNCSHTNLQRMGDQLGRESLPVDKILQIGSEFLVQLHTTIECDKCVSTRRVSQALSQITFRLINFYEAVYADATDNLSSEPSSLCSSSGSGHISAGRISLQERINSPTASVVQRHSGCKSVPRDMRLGEMPIIGPEGRLLIRVVLVDACLELNGKIQELKAVMEESLGVKDQQYLAQYNGIIGRCLDRLANLIGLLRLDALATDRS